MDRGNLERADAVEDGGEAMRPDLQYDVPRVAEHPEVKRSRMGLVQPSIPGDRHMIESTDVARVQTATVPRYSMTGLR